MHVDLRFARTYHAEPARAELNGDAVLYPGGQAYCGEAGSAVRVFPADSKPWKAVVARQRHGATAANAFLTAHPDGKRFCIACDGWGFVVASDDRTDWSEVPLYGLDQVLVGHELVIYAGALEVAAYGSRGLLWTTRRVSADGIRLHSISDGVVHGECWSAGLWRPLALAVDSGRVIDGPSPAEVFE